MICTSIDGEIRRGFLALKNRRRDIKEGVDRMNFWLFSPAQSSPFYNDATPIIFCIPQLNRELYIDVESRHIKFYI